MTDILNQSIGGFSLGHILTAVITFIICILVVRVLLRVLERILGKTKQDGRVRGYILSGAKVVLYIIAVVIAAQGLGVNMTSLVALLSVASLGITLAAEDILANVAGGLVILSSHPFAIGDFIESNGVMGNVELITLNHTKLLSPDGQYVMVPNKELAGSKVINYTATGKRRVTRKVTASYDTPTETVKAACAKALSMTDKILTAPAPAVYLSDYGASAIEYTVFCWCEPNDFWGVTFGLAENLRTAFAETGAVMTYDHLNVHIVENKG